MKRRDDTCRQEKEVEPECDLDLLWSNLFGPIFQMMGIFTSLMEGGERK
ncbi:hypothetical protein LQZ18_11530 [Lachnospiraceae bacterium ZAX-1]